MGGGKPEREEGERFREEGDARASGEGGAALPVVEEKVVVEGVRRDGWRLCGCNGEWLYANFGPWEEGGKMEEDEVRERLCE